jgi:hypothetical protein
VRLKKFRIEPETHLGLTQLSDYTNERMTENFFRGKGGGGGGGGGGRDKGNEKRSHQKR